MRTVQLYFQLQFHSLVLKRLIFSPLQTMDLHKAISELQLMEGDLSFSNLPVQPLHKPNGNQPWMPSHFQPQAISPAIALLDLASVTGD